MSSSESKIIVLQIENYHEKDKSKIMKIISKCLGLSSIGIDAYGNVTATGTVDPVEIVDKLEKSKFRVNIRTIKSEKQEQEDKKKQEEKEKKKQK